MSREIWLKNEASKTVLYVGIHRGNDYIQIRKDNPNLVAQFLYFYRYSECTVINEEEAEYLVHSDGYKEITIGGYYDSKRFSG